MKIDTYYDIACDICARHRSTDFEMGLATSRKGLSNQAKKEGWIFREKENICPICLTKPEAKYLYRRIEKLSKIKSAIPEEYMFTGSFESGGVRKISPIGLDLSKKKFEDIPCPCCGQNDLRVKNFGYEDVCPEHIVGCDSCDWQSPTGYISDYGEAISEFLVWLEAFLLLGSPKERIPEDLSLLFYPEGEWREKKREEREKEKEK